MRSTIAQVKHRGPRAGNGACSPRVRQVWSNRPRPRCNPLDLGLAWPLGPGRWGLVAAGVERAQLHRIVRGHTLYGAAFGVVFGRVSPLTFIGGQVGPTA